MNELRKKLDNLPEPNTKKGFGLQKSLIEDSLRKIYNHEIKHSTHCKCEFPTLQMCFSYALGIPDNVLKKNLFNYKGFIKFLVDEKVLIPSDSGRLVLYGNYPFFEHAGLLKDGKVISKWGRGHIWVHNVEDVPKKYGNYGYYNLPSKDKVIKKLKEYSKQITITKVAKSKKTRVCLVR